MIVAIMGGECGGRAMKKPLAPASHLAPSLRAVPFQKGAADTEAIVLTDRQREELARIGLRLRLPARMVIYREGSAADSIFAVVEGAVKTSCVLRSGSRFVSAFLFARDLFGLAENGLYVNRAQTITPVTLYRLPMRELTVLLKHDADLQFHFLAKVTHELRESQRRAILVSRRDAVGRLAMFVVLMSKRLAQDSEPHVPLPMTRSDIADFLGLSLESVTRAAAELERRRLVKFETRHLAQIVDATKLAKLAAAM
jgi:CRP/FNR family transcriptional regulator, anaerobic regulatory protein